MFMFKIQSLYDVGTVIIPLTAGKLRLRPFKEVAPNHLGFSAWKADAFPTVQRIRPMNKVAAKLSVLKLEIFKCMRKSTDRSFLLEVSQSQKIHLI